MPGSVNDAIDDFESLELGQSSPQGLQASKSNRLRHPLLRTIASKPPANVHHPSPPGTIFNKPLQSANDDPVTTFHSALRPTKHNERVSLSSSPYSPGSASSSTILSVPVTKYTVNTLFSSASDVQPLPFPSKTAPKHVNPSLSEIMEKPIIHDSISSENDFSENAPILCLPELDNWLSKLPAHKFTPFPEVNTGASKPSNSTVPRKFPPLQELEKGQSLVDLSLNSTVRPSWKNRNSIFSFLSSLVLGIAGSSIASSVYSLSGIYDAVQIFALILSTVVPNTGKHFGQTWKRLFLGIIPNVLALNIFPLITQKLLFLTVFILIGLTLVYYFHRATRPLIYNERNTEGLYRSGKKSSGWGLVIASFVLIVLYLPISTIAVHGLVWSSDFWPTEPDGSPLPPGSPVCYTTAANRESTNLAPLAVILCVVTVLSLTIYFPIRLSHAITHCLPSVDTFTELGKVRSTVELEHEYQRRLERDPNPFAYLYNDYKRKWGTYKSIYLFAKLSALLIVALADPSNCLVQTLPMHTVLLIRQTLLILATAAFLVMQTWLSPFIYPVSNASEWTSRTSYVVTSLIGLARVLGGKGKAAFEGPVLYTVYAITYGLNIYFTIIHWAWVQRIVKRITKRIDFSIDIFSPYLDVSPTSPHIKRRIWQETISTLFLTSPDSHIPSTQMMVFAEDPNVQWPPYLLDFQGTTAERHVENIKILRELGRDSYRDAAAQTKDDRFTTAFASIADRLVGPDVFWAGVEEQLVGSRWGNAWCIPFPPTVVIQLDDGAPVVLNTLAQFESLLEQNISKAILFARHLRRSLRALENQQVYWPYTHAEEIGPRNALFCCGAGYSAISTTFYEFATLNIERQGRLVFNGCFDFASGFNVKLAYSPKMSIDGSDIGLTSECLLTPRLASFLALNERTIKIHMPRLLSEIERYRRTLRLEAHTKYQTLSYGFLERVFECPAPPDLVLAELNSSEKDISGKLMHMFQVAQKSGALVGVDERMRVASQNEVSAWWYLFWDDFWRRNHSTISNLRLHAFDFDPCYPTSLAYRPLPRAVLDAFLVQRGLLFPMTGSRFQSRGFLCNGMVNRVYFRLNQILFGPHASRITNTYIGGRSFDPELAVFDARRDGSDPAHGRSSSLGTGGGTDHDDSSIRQRPHYRYEEALTKRPNRWQSMLALWFGLSPYGPVQKNRTKVTLLDRY